MANLKDLIVNGTSRFIGKIYGLVTRAEADENGLNFNTGYVKKGDVLVLDSSNYTTYYNSSTYTLTLPENCYSVHLSPTLFSLTHSSGQFKIYRIIVPNVKNFDKLTIFVQHSYASTSGSYKENSYYSNSYLYLYDSDYDSYNKDLSHCDYIGNGGLKNYYYSGSRSYHSPGNNDGFITLLNVEGTWYYNMDEKM